VTGKVAALLFGVLLLSGCGGGSRSGTPTALWIGDSYTAGSGGTSTLDGEAYQVSAELHWHAHLDAEGGTGFVANLDTTQPNYEPVPARLQDDIEEFPDPGVVVIDAGRNDQGFPARKVRRAVVSFFRALAKAFPSSAVVVIAPYLMTSKPTDFAALRHLLAQQAKRHGWAFVDPLADGWINASSAKLLSPDGVHPDPAGYDYLVAHLAPAIEKALAAAHETVR
jgi:lysophospholipase L1-like esterase